jgi:NitT/TauT family transport system substrate-binding protein
MMWNRRRWLGAGVACAAIGVTVGATTQAKVPTQRVAVLVHDALQIKQLPLVLAWQLGYWRVEGLEVDWLTQGMPGWQDAEVVSSSFDLALKSQTTTRALTAFAMLGRAPQVVLGQHGRGGRAVDNIAQLRGRTIGVAGWGSLSHHVAELLLLRAGVHRQEVHFVDVSDSPRLLEAFYSGHVDALSFTDPWASLLERRGDVRVLSDTRNLREAEQLFGGPVPCTCLMATPEFLDEREHACQALSNGVVRALKWLQTAGPTDLVRVLPETYMQGDRSVFLDAFSKSRGSFASDGLIPARGPAKLLQIITELQPRSGLERVDPKAVWTNRFVERSKAIHRV